MKKSKKTATVKPESKTDGDFDFTFDSPVFLLKS
jgi:hypothetical protein